MPLKIEAPKPKAVAPPVVVPPPVVQTPVPPVIPVKQLIIEVDDAGLHPAWPAAVKKGERVRIVFRILANSSDWGGFVFKTDPGVGWGATNVIRPGHEEAVEFVADKSFEFSSQLASDYSLRGKGGVNVEE